MFGIMHHHAVLKPVYTRIVNNNVHSRNSPGKPFPILLPANIKPLEPASGLGSRRHARSFINIGHNHGRTFLKKAHRYGTTDSPRSTRDNTGLVQQF